MTDMTFCKSCGANFDGSDRFCTSCGLTRDPGKTPTPQSQIETKLKRGNYAEISCSSGPIIPWEDAVAVEPEHCPSCKDEIREGAIFCKSCGERIVMTPGDVVKPPVPNVPPPP